MFNDKNNWTGWLKRGAVLLSAFGMLSAYGCASDEAPMAPNADGPKTIAVGSEDFVHNPSANSASLSNPFGDDWYEIGDFDVAAGQPASADFGRYSFAVAAGEADPGAQLTIYERDPDVVDVRFDGGGFAGDLTVFIDCSGTNVDPDAPNYDGSVPEFYQLDEDAQAWVLVPGQFDAAAKTYVVTLSATYSANGGAGMSVGTGDWSFFRRAALMGTRGTGDW